MEVSEEVILNKIVYLINSLIFPDRIYLFGSRAKSKNCRASDFDIAIDAPKPESRIVRELEEKIETIAGFYSVDMIFLGDIDKDFRDIILSTGKILYEK